MFSTLEATAPCRLELFGGRLEEDAGASPDRVLRLAVALDRRVWCRVEPRDAGLEIHSKDTGERVTAGDARDIPAGPAARVAGMLLAAGVRSGLRVVTQVRVPEDAGLGTDGALQVAVWAALGQGSAEILGGAVPTDLAAASDLALCDRHTALFGGIHVVRMRGGAPRVERVAADPARVEECLLLVDPGPEAPFRPLAARFSAAWTRAFEAVVSGACDDVAAILADVHRGRFDSAPPVVRKLVLAIEGAGGAAWPCGRLIAVWAVPGKHSPGPREAVASALKDAGARSFAARVDLRGLEVE